MKKKLSVLMLFVVGLFALSFVASALPLTINEVEVDDTILSDSGTGYIYAKEKNDKMEIKVVLTAQEDLKDVQVEAVLRGYDYPDLIEDISSAFDMKANVTYQKTLKLTLPIRMDKDAYKLRIRVEDRDGDTVQQNYELQVEADNHLLYIRDIVFSPDNFVKTGRALLTTVRMKNVGEQDEDGVKVTVSIPGLGVSASDYIDEVDEDESTTSEELYLRIPECAKPGEYDVKVDVSYHDGEEKESKISTITVVDGDVCPTNVPAKETDDKVTEKTIISVGAGSQQLTAGQGGAIYPITITNQGASSKTYELAVDVPGDWATYQVTPSNVAVVAAGDSATFYVYVSAKETAQAGESMFSLTVISSGDVLKQIPLKATVAKSEPVTSWASVKKALEIALVVLVVLLVIIGLIIGFNKLKGSESEESEEEMGKTYY